MGDLNGVADFVLNTLSFRRESSDMKEHTLRISQLKAGEVISKHLWIRIISLSICTPPSEFAARPATVLTLLSVTLSRLSRSALEIILIFAINLLLQAVDPFVHCALRLQKAFLNIVTNDGQIIYFIQ